MTGRTWLRIYNLNSTRLYVATIVLKGYVADLSRSSATNSDSLSDSLAAASRGCDLTGWLQLLQRHAQKRNHGSSDTGSSHRIQKCRKSPGLVVTHRSEPLGILHFFFFLEIGSFYNSPRVKQLSFTVFESIQTIF